MTEYTIESALIRFDETTSDCGETDLPRPILDGLVAFGFLTKRRAGRYGFVYTMTDKAEAVVRPQEAAEANKPDEDWFGDMLASTGAVIPFDCAKPEGDQDRRDASDEVIRQWVDRHDLGGALGYSTDARCAFEDAQTAVMAQAAGND